MNERPPARTPAATVQRKRPGVPRIGLALAGGGLSLAALGNDVP